MRGDPVDVGSGVFRSAGRMLSMRAFTASIIALAVSGHTRPGESIAYRLPE